MEAGTADHIWSIKETPFGVELSMEQQSVIQDLTADWAETFQKARVSKIRDILNARGLDSLESLTSLVGRKETQRSSRT
jgi:hypothetical protein